MLRRLLPALVALVALAVPSCALAAADGWTSYDRPATNSVVVDKDVPITMRDGTVLYANVERPAQPGRYPVLVTQTAYGKDGLVIGALGGSGGSYLAERGYVQVTVDDRGTGASEGVWDSFGEPEQRDGYDVVEWAARQPWSDGNVGLNGESYMAITQLVTAAQKPPHLKAIFPIVPMADGYRDIVFSGGDFNLAFIPLWLGLVTVGSIAPPGYLADGQLPDLARGLTALTSHIGGVLNFQAGTVVNGLAEDDHIAYDSDFWKTRSPIELADRIDVPTFIVGGTHDIFQRGEPLLYERLKRRVPTKLLIGPWTHVTTGSGLPRDGVPSLNALQLRWFDRYLKGIDDGAEQMPAVTQWAYGKNGYETVPDWPNPKLDPQTLHLRGGKRLSADGPGAGEAPQSFVQHPLAGICTMSTGQWTAGLTEGIPCFTNERPNALSGGATYTTAPLRSDLHINGPLDASLWVTTTAADAAVSVRVEDIAPDGTVQGLTNGWQSARLRATDDARARVVKGTLLQPWHPFTKASVLPVKAGAPMRLDVEVFPTDAVFRAGHSIRVTVDPADFPHQFPPIPALLRRLGGKVSILTDPAHDSTLALPVVGDQCAVPAVAPVKAKAKAKKAKANKKAAAHGRKKRKHTAKPGAASAGCASLPAPDETRGPSGT